MELKGGDPRPKGMRIFRLAGLAYAVAVFGALLANGLVSCTGTEVPDPDDALFGTVRSHGGSPAAGARVIAWAQEDALKKAEADTSVRTKDTVYTDDQGNYVFDKPLVQRGYYNLYFEDTLSDASIRTLEHRERVLYDTTGLPQPVNVKLAPPSQLVLTVKDYDTDSTIAGAECTIPGSPYQEPTGLDGIAVFYVSAGDYSVYCSSAPSHQTPLWNTLPLPGVTSDSKSQETIYLYPFGKKPDPISPPETLLVRYDENSGFANLSWSSVYDSRLHDYGVGRVNIDSGGGATERSVYETSVPDAVFGPGDSVQQKNLLYSVSCHKSNPADNAGSRRTYANLTGARRPWAYGPRIDSLIAVPRDSAYQAGDTVRFAAFWNNRLHENDSLYWWIVGGADVRKIGVNLPAKGSDTLSVVLPAGEYKINLTIRDSEGYRSWLSLPFRM